MYKYLVEISIINGYWFFRYIKKTKSILSEIEFGWKFPFIINFSFVFLNYKKRPRKFDLFVVQTRSNCISKISLIYENKSILSISYSVIIHTIKKHNIVKSIHLSLRSKSFLLTKLLNIYFYILNENRNIPNRCIHFQKTIFHKQYS